MTGSDLRNRYICSQILKKFKVEGIIYQYRNKKKINSNLSTSKKEKKLLSSLGEDIGLLFQLSDDFLDKKGSRKLMGKPVRKDNKKGKSTLLKLMGDKKAFLYAESLKKNILNKLRKHGKNARELINTINFIFERKF